MFKNSARGQNSLLSDFEQVLPRALTWVEFFLRSKTSPLKKLSNKKYLMGHSRPLLSIFQQYPRVYIQYKALLMTGFKPRTSGIGSNCSANWATAKIKCFRKEKNFHINKTETTNGLAYFNQMICSHHVISFLFEQTQA